MSKLEKTQGIKVSDELRINLKYTFLICSLLTFITCAITISFQPKFPLFKYHYGEPPRYSEFLCGCLCWGATPAIQSRYPLNAIPIECDTH